MKAQTQWIIFGLLAVVAIAVIFYRTYTPTEIQENMTIPNVIPEVVVESGAKYGDLVTINFELALPNGTIVDTNDGELAKTYGIKDYVKGPYTFILGQSGKVYGFDEALKGIEINQTIQKIIEPTEKEIILNVNKTKTIRRHLTINKQQAFPLTLYKEYFNKEPKIGDIVKSDKFVFKYKVINITKDTVITKMEIKEGEKYVLPSTEWNSTVFDVAENDAIFYQIPVENQKLITPFGPATINMTKSMMFINFEPQLNAIVNKSLEMGGGFSIPAQFQIIAIDDNNFTIKRYGLLTDKRLALKATLLNIQTDVKEVEGETKIKTETVTA